MFKDFHQPDQVKMVSAFDSTYKVSRNTRPEFEALTPAEAFSLPFRFIASSEVYSSEEGSHRSSREDTSHRRGLRSRREFALTFPFDLSTLAQPDRLPLFLPFQMPSENRTHGFPSSMRTASYHITSILGVKQSRKNPSSFKLLVIKDGNLNKRYEFEGENGRVVSEIVGIIKDL